MDDVLSVLKRARERLAKPGAWTRGALARDENGREVDGFDPRAVCWCALGAIEAEVGTGGYYETYDCGQALEAVSPILAVPEFNDAADGVEAVLDLYDQAIARLESVQQP